MWGRLHRFGPWTGIIAQTAGFARLLPGWNEIDAVGLLDQTGKVSWAISAKASSTYSEPGGTGQLPRGEPAPPKQPAKS